MKNMSRKFIQRVKLIEKAKSIKRTAINSIFLIKPGLILWLSLLYLTLSPFFLVFLGRHCWGLPLEKQLSGEIILQRLDANLTSDNKIIQATMTVHGRRTSRTFRMKSWIQGTEKAFTEYLDPPRERGTKMLKIEDKLWLYSPDTDRIIMISGHMLRQSVMGSDLSYEDLMEDPVLHNLYTAEIIEDTIYENQPCWVLKLTAKKQDVAYHEKKLWVDKEKYIALYEEWYAKGGKLLKTIIRQRVEKINNRWVPMEGIFKDVLKEGSGTEFKIEEITFNASIPEYIFSKANLRR